MTRRPHDPGADAEDEGMPDLRDGTPEQQWSSDPQRLPVAGDEPTVAEEQVAWLYDEPDEAAGLLYDSPDPDLPRDQDVHSPFRVPGSS